MRAEIHSSINEIPRCAWDALLTPQDPPFLSHAFLSSLEKTGCAVEMSGWHPRFIAVYDNGALVGAQPLYRKDHSHGEFIFDFAWADAAHRIGLPYYPKLVSAIPFTPVTARKFLTHPDGETDEIRGCLLSGARQAAEQEPSTGIHWLFLTDEESNYLNSKQIASRHTHQFQWTNQNYSSFDDYLGRFRSKRRAQIRRERRSLQAENIRVKAVSGTDATPEQKEAAWRFYKQTVDQFMWGRRYLNRAFFDAVFDASGSHIVLLLAELDGRTIAGTFNMVNDGAFYGRYWGCDVQIPFLHFELCCYAPVELAIDRGWSRVEAGAGGQHKMGRGFLPTTIYSAHEVYLPGFREPIEEALKAERAHHKEVMQQCQSWVFKD